MLFFGYFLMMPRKNLIRTELYYYHVTTRANHKQWFSIPLEDVWKIVTYSMKKAQKNNPALVSQFVLMSNHYHMLIRTPNEDIDKFMFWFNKTFSDLLRAKTGLENRMFGSSYKWSLIKSDRYLYNVFRYIYQNPVRAHICEYCHEYPYSTHYYEHHQKQVPFPFTSLNHMEEDHEFLNYPIEQVQNHSIKLGLRKSIFKEVKQR